MEKKSTYTVMTPPDHTCKLQWVTWAAVGISVVALVVSSVVASVVKEQAAKINHMEGRMVEMEDHLQQILRYTIANHEYEYNDYGDDDYGGDDDDDDDDYAALDDDYQSDQPVGGHEEGITVRRVVRRRRQVNSLANEIPGSLPPVPIYEEAYGGNKKVNPAPLGFRLYNSLLLDSNAGTDEEGDDTSHTTESSIKPHHRSVVRQPDSADGGDDNDVQGNNRHATLSPQTRSPRLTQRRRTKSLHGSRRTDKKRQQHRSRSNQDFIVFRPGLVKMTSSDDDESSPNSVLSRPTDTHKGIPRVVQQDDDSSSSSPVAFVRPPTSSIYNKPSTSARQQKRQKLGNNRQHRRRRRTRPVVTVAHFGVTSSTTNTTTANYHRGNRGSTGQHLDWSPATWMDKLGLNRKYSLNRGTVTVKEAGLYYVYAQVLYESGRGRSGYEILVDDIPILECRVPALRPAPSCHTSGLTYLPRNAEVRIRNLDDNLVTIQRHQNTFFGLVRLMDARYTAEEMLLG